MCRSTTPPRRWSTWGTRRGYYGTVVAPGGVVVYGTGYPYVPWVGTVWYGPPVTYGVRRQHVLDALDGLGVRIRDLVGLRHP